jgi:ribonucleotide monophosphatase NagD (HAD superfamily)
VVGKPAAALFDHVLEGVATTPDRAVMVGDDIESDIAGAVSAGLPAILVRTGKYRSDAVLASSIQPTATVDSIVEVPDLLSTQAPTR